MKTNLLLLLLFLLAVFPVLGQGFLHVDGKYIYDGNGDEYIIRGLGTGNWMLQEGYMMKTADLGGTQHEFRARLEETIGVAKTDSFYNAWLQYHFTRADVDSMKAWGYNTVRVAMHYKWFTPPIEEEPVEGEITWRDKGFEMLDSLLVWCGDNQMYLILDLHGAPGGQGKDANISDYDPGKPSLWESDLNKDKTVALWAKLAERYADEPWIGGYDLINETNWTFPEGNNSQMRNLFGRITEAIRMVDQNHIIFIEGNGFANDFSGLTPPWDDNMVYSFHKYWNYNTKGSIQWVLDLRDTYDIPIWLGETGENSNTWFTNLVHLCESNRIGWSWWPVKKSGINNPLRVEVNEGYERLLEYWKGEGSEMTEEEAFQAVLQFAENHKIENCIVQKDVIDAKIRQPHTTETKPFRKHTTGNPVFFTDYDLGRVHYAYFDKDTANYHLDQDGQYTNWNQGWAYRNDGVDIEVCSDVANISNGYNVGWTEDGEWMQYTLEVGEEAAWELSVRYAAANDSRIRFEADGMPLTPVISLPATGGYQSWATLVVEDIVLPAGTVQIRCIIEQGGVNLNYFSFDSSSPVGSVDFSAVLAKTEYPGNVIQLFLNKPFTGEANALLGNEFNIEVSGDELEVSEVLWSEENPRKLELFLPDYLNDGENILVSYAGSFIVSNGQELSSFELEVQNLIPEVFEIPGSIEAEDFAVNNGFELEDCQDTGGGLNTAFANPGDYVEYYVEVKQDETFQVEYRVATERTAPQLVFLQEQNSEWIPLDTMTFQSTGGWQKWQTQTGKISLKEGRGKIRLMTLYSEYNLNKIKLSVGASVQESVHLNRLVLCPNPVDSLLIVNLPFLSGGICQLSAYDLSGNLIRSWKRRGNKRIELDVKKFSEGLYFLKVNYGTGVANGKFFVSASGRN
ncbi:carbohydrate-binding protein [Marinilabilia salmonicolor]|nr:carbohydrate-binding protein [Marinilabilia salmonicolor]